MNPTWFLDGNGLSFAGALYLLTDYLIERFHL